MVNRFLSKININIDEGFIIEFDGWENVSIDGISFIEKNFRKKDDELMEIGLLTKIGKIFLKRNGAIHLFDIIDGDKFLFKGKYTIGYLGHKGRITVDEIMSQKNFTIDDYFEETTKEP